VTKNNALLQADLNSRVSELGRERHIAERLQKQLNVQNAAHNELIELFKNTQASVLEDLTKNGGVLANLLNFDKPILEK
jgi:hypothetical protein